MQLNDKASKNQPRRSVVNKRLYKKMAPLCYDFDFEHSGLCECVQHTISMVARGSFFDSRTPSFCHVTEIKQNDSQ